MFKNRVNWIIEQARRKKVLDVGCVGEDGGSLHKEIARVAD